jgi:hypothetical protein
MVRRAPQLLIRPPSSTRLTARPPTATRTGGGRAAANLHRRRRVPAIQHPRVHAAGGGHPLPRHGAPLGVRRASRLPSTPRHTAASTARARRPYHNPMAKHPCLPRYRWRRRGFTIFCRAGGSIQGRTVLRPSQLGVLVATAGHSMTSVSSSLRRPHSIGSSSTGAPFARNAMHASAAPVRSDAASCVRAFYCSPGSDRTSENAEPGLTYGKWASCLELTPSSTGSPPSMCGIGSQGSTARLPC